MGVKYLIGAHEFYYNCRTNWASADFLSVALLISRTNKRLVLKSAVASFSPTEPAVCGLLTQTARGFLKYASKKSKKLMVKNRQTTEERVTKKRQQKDGALTSVGLWN